MRKMRKMRISVQLIFVARKMRKFAPTRKPVALETLVLDPDPVKMGLDPQHCLSGRIAFFVWDDCSTCRGGQSYLQGRIVLLTGEGGLTCREGQSYLQGRVVLLAGGHSLTYRGGWSYLQVRIIGSVADPELSQDRPDPRIWIRKNASGSTTLAITVVWPKAGFS